MNVFYSFALIILLQCSESEGVFKPFSRIFSWKHFKSHDNARGSRFQGYPYSASGHKNSLPSTKYHDDCDCDYNPFQPIQTPHYSHSPTLETHLKPPTNVYSLSVPPTETQQVGFFSNEPPHYNGNQISSHHNAHSGLEIVPAVQLSGPNHQYFPEANVIHPAVPGTHPEHSSHLLPTLLTPPGVNYEYEVSSNSLSLHPNTGHVNFPEPSNGHGHTDTAELHNLYIPVEPQPPSHPHVNKGSYLSGLSETSTVLSPIDKQVVFNLMNGPKNQGNHQTINSISPYDGAEEYSDNKQPYYVEGSYKKPSLTHYDGEYSQIFDEESPVEVEVTGSGKYLQTTHLETSTYPEYKIPLAIVDTSSFPTQYPSPKAKRDHILMPTLIKVLETMYRNRLTNGLSSS